MDEGLLTLVTERAIVCIDAIAAIRTFLDYFLERDVGEVRRRQREGPERARETTGVR